jgi:hypothetical protein
MAPPVCSRAQLENLSEEDEDRDDGSGLVVDRDGALVAEGRREEAGREGGHEAVEVGDAGAERDEREHVEMARLQRRQPTLEEGPAAPQDHRRRE